jgi:RHS repeat-associated protein
LIEKVNTEGNMRKEENAFLISSIPHYFNETMKRIICGTMAVLMVIASSLPAKRVNAYTYDGGIPSDSQTDSAEPVDTMPDYPTTTDLDSNIKDVALVGEVESMRTECTKTFQRVDGTFVMALYNEAVHYQKDGKWEDIDNTLAFDESDSSYKNRNNAFEVKFPDSLDGNKKFKLSMGDYEVTWSVLDIGKSSIQCGEPESKSSDIKNLSGINQEVLYEDVMSGVDLQYIIAGTQVKENIILGKYSKDFSISFEYSVKNLVLDQKDGHYAFFDENGNLIFDFSSLFAYDAEGDIFEDIALSVSEKNKNVYEVVLSLDDKWASQASYPVTIDPSISLPSPGLYIRDTYVRTGSTTNYSGSAYVYFGDNLLYSYLGYLNFTVPTYLKDFDIIYSTLFLHRYTGTDDMFLHELPSYISNLGGLTWANRPTADTQLIDFGVVSSTNTEIQLDITTSVDKWNKLGLTNMPGFELSSNDTLLKVYSIDSATTPPAIEIGFIDSNGIKDYWTYNSQDVSYAGTGYISDYTQDLFFVRNDINFQTNLQTLGVSFVFNNRMAISTTPNIGYGNGWNISYNLMLYYDSALALNYSIDYTGNRVYYFPTTIDSRTPNNQVTNHMCFLAEEGSGSKLVKKYVSGIGLAETFILTTDNTKYSFDVVYNDLISISSLDNDLTLTISRNTNRKKINYILDTRGNQILFSYGTNGNLQSATLKTKDDIVGTDLHELEKVYYGYYGTTNFLHDIWYLTDYDQSGDLTLNLSDLKNVDRIVRYDNYASKLLATAYVKYIDEETGVETVGEEIQYHYFSDTDPAVSYFESFFKSTKYSKVTYDNVPKQTMITDHSGDFVLYSFDRYGHTVNILDKNGNAIYYQYHDIFIDYASYVNGLPNYVENHRKVCESSPQQPVFNPVQNYSFEEGLTGWVLEGSGTRLISSQQVTSGLSSLQFISSSTTWNSATQTISLAYGVYTIYVDAKNMGSNPSGVFVQVGSEVQNIPNDGQWHCLSFVVVIDSEEEETSILLKSQTEGQIFFDTVLIGKGVDTKWVNLVDNPSFEYGVSGNWTTSSGDLTLYQINDQTGALNDLYQDVLGEKAIGLNGEINTTIERNYLDDFVGAGGTLYVGGWALNYTAPSVNNANLVAGKTFRIFVHQVIMVGGVPQEFESSIPFNLSYDGWQYAYGEVTIDANCTQLHMGFQYEGEGKVLFDGLSAFFIANKTEYEFDSYGRIVQVLFEDGTEYTCTYNEGEPETNMIPSEITDNHGNSIDIESEDNRIKKVLRENYNVKISPAYDEYGRTTGYNIQTVDESLTYFSTSTSYGHFNQYLATSTDEFGQITTYSTNVINGLLEYIQNSQGDKAHYEYYDDGMLMRIYCGETYSGSTSPYILYEYDSMNRLVRIELDDDFCYNILYDDMGRMDYVQVNNQELIRYSYLDNIENLIDPTFHDYEINETNGTIATAQDTTFSGNEDSYYIHTTVGGRDPNFGGAIEVDPNSTYNLSVDLQSISGTIQMSVFEYSGTPSSATYVRVQKSSTKSTVGSLNFQFVTSRTTRQIIVAFYGASTYTVTFINLVLDAEDTYTTNLLSGQSYINGDKIFFEYNEDNQIETIRFSENGGSKIAKYKYQYDSSGRLQVYFDLVNGTSETYTYNQLGQLTEVNESNGNKTTYSYNTAGNVSGLDFFIASVDGHSSYVYQYNSFQSSQIQEMDFLTFLGNQYSRDYHDEEDALDRLEYINMVLDILDNDKNIKKNFVYVGYTTRISDISYEIYGAGVDYKFSYTYDTLGNIIHESFYEGTTLKLYRNYEYDELNQLVVEDSRDVNYSSTTLTATNYTKYYYYDLRGNRTDVKTFLYGQNDTTVPTAPAYYELSTGEYDGYMIYNGNKTYQNRYYLNVGQTPSLSFSYYDVWDFDHEYPISGMTTTMTYDNLNTSVAGYYYRQYTATDEMYYTIVFRIVFQVGTPGPIPVIPQSHVHYNYNESWEDQLYNIGTISYVNGVAQPMVVQQQYTYDTLGNPTSITNFVYNGLTYSSASFNWSGRQLSYITIMSGSSSPAYMIMYKYNDQGYRTQQLLYTFSGYTPVLTSTIKYELEGDKVIYETNGTYGILYIYDFDGTLIGFNYDSNVTDAVAGNDYFYLRNQMGDITHIVNSSGTAIVKYSYDAYGNIVYQTPSETIGNVNPYKYRGYRYDKLIGMYYLNSRYYNPQIGRFLNADGMLGAKGDILSTNMYAYCANNPVMYLDPSGEASIFALAILVILLFTPVGGTLAQIATSAVSYVGMAVWALGDLAFNGGNGAWADMNRIHWNPLNSDESAVFASTSISFYQGEPVFMKDSGRSGSFYFISLNRYGTIDTLRHERGHGYQSMMMGIATFAITVGLPSWQQWGLCANPNTYYKAPWETMADILGGVQGRTHTQQEISRAWTYYEMSHLIIPSVFYW